MEENNHNQTSENASFPLPPKPAMPADNAIPEAVVAQYDPADESSTSKLGIILVVLLVLSFLLPGLGVLTVPLIAIFAMKGGRKQRGQVSRTPMQNLFRAVGYICLTLIVGFVGFVTLIFILLASGDFKMG